MHVPYIDTSFSNHFPAFLMLKLPEILRELTTTPTADGTPLKGAVFKGLRMFLASTSLVDLADRKAQADTALLFLQVIQLLCLKGQ